MNTKLTRFTFFVGVLATMATPSWGEPQDNEVVEMAKPDAQAEDAQEEDDFAKMPAPLSAITGNLLDLEKSGHLKIIKGGHARTKMFDDQAMVWTVEIVKPLTCGRAILLLHEVSDVRFYRDDKDYHSELFVSRLFYESWLDSGAVSHEILDQDERFDIWMDLTDAEASVLRHNEANKVVFQRPRRIYKNDASLWRWK